MKTAPLDSFLKFYVMRSPRESRLHSASKNVCHAEDRKVCLKYTVGTANADFDKNMLLLKNLQFSPNHYETLTQ